MSTYLANYFTINWLRYPDNPNIVLIDNVKAIICYIINGNDNVFKFLQYVDKWQENRERKRTKVIYPVDTNAWRDLLHY